MSWSPEFRDENRLRVLAREISRTVTQPWTIMEVCGGQTHAIMKFGIDKVLDPKIRLIHGPGCPVCVTPIEWVDRAISIAKQNGVIFCSFGDMLRVPGSHEDLLTARSLGADVRMLYSPLDVIAIAEQNRDREVVFFGVGFETTAPATALAILQADKRGLKNLSFLVCHVLVPPALEALLMDSKNEVQGFLAAGHVCAVMGYEEYQPIVEKYRVPIVITGFEPYDILEGVLLAVRQLENGAFSVENQYVRAVESSGNRMAKQNIETVFSVTDRDWRGIGSIQRSGLRIRDQFRAYDAETRFSLSPIEPIEKNECISGDILTGKKRPTECAEFGKRCHPTNPLGATMVSGEGACAAYYRYAR